MKATTIIVCLIISLFGSAVQAQDIPGGIVYSDGKNAVYYDYQSNRTTKLTSDLPRLEIRGPLAASEDGLVLVWQEGNKFQARILPDGDPYSVTMKELSPPPGNVRGLTLSPEGARLSFESTEKGRSWSLTEPGDLRVRRDNYNAHPKYVAKVEEFNTTTVLQTASGWYWRYGNSASYPPMFPIRTSYESLNAQRHWKVVEGPLLHYLTTPDICPGLTVTVRGAQTRFSARHDAHFLAWQKSSSWQPTNQLFAVIYQSGAGWGPIEIHNSQYTGITSSPRDPFYGKPGFWEIPISLTSCEGLAWKPDGSLTYLSRGRVISFDADSIRAGIRNSGLETDKRVFEKGRVVNCIIPARNILDIKGELVAYGIDGDRLHWVTNDTFLFRGKEGSLRNISSWHEGRIEILCSAPEEFSYCDRPPTGVSVTTPGIASGRNRVIEAVQGNVVSGKNPEFSVGSIRMRWYGHDAESLRIWIGKLENQETLEFAFPTETKLDDIRDPSRYQYRNGDSTSLRIRLNHPVILRLNERYAAIMPLAVEPKAGWQGSPPPPYEWMTYEWKYWSRSAQIDANAKNGNGLAGTAQAPTSGRTTTSERQIAVGDIKTTWRRSSPTKVEFAVNPLPGGANAEFASLSSNLVLDSITDPSEYRYIRRGDPPRTHAFHIIQMRWIIILRVGDRCAAIKPIEIRRQGTTETLVYEWKYWPGASLVTGSGTPTKVATANGLAAK